MKASEASQRLGGLEFVAWRFWDGQTMWNQLRRHVFQPAL